MYNRSTRKLIRRPRIIPAHIPEVGGRVRMSIGGIGVFDLEPGEAMTLANWLVDMAEQVTTGEA